MTSRVSHEASPYWESLLGRVFCRPTSEERAAHNLGVSSSWCSTLAARSSVRMKGGAIFTQKLQLVDWVGKIRFNLSVFRLRLPSLHPPVLPWLPTTVVPHHYLNRELTSAYESQALGLYIVYLSGLRALAWKLGLPWRDEATCNHQQKAWQCCPSVLKLTMSSTSATGKPHHPQAQSCLSVAGFPSSAFPADGSHCKETWRAEGERVRTGTLVRIECDKKPKWQEFGGV